MTEDVYYRELLTRRHLEPLSYQMVKLTRTGKSSYGLEVAYRALVDKDIWQYRLLMRELQEPSPHFGVVGCVDNLEVVAPVFEQTFGTPTAQRVTTGVEHYLSLIHAGSHPSSCVASQGRVAHHEGPAHRANE
jgi:hypothetical protein